MRKFFGGMLEHSVPDSGTELWPRQIGSAGCERRVRRAVRDWVGPGALPRCGIARNAERDNQNRNCFYNHSRPPRLITWERIPVSGGRVRKNWTYFKFYVIACLMLNINAALVSEPTKAD